MDAFLPPGNARARALPPELMSALGSPGAPPPGQGGPAPAAPFLPSTVGPGPTAPTAMGASMNDLPPEMLPGAERAFFGGGPAQNATQLMGAPFGAPAPGTLPNAGPANAPVDPILLQIMSGNSPLIANNKPPKKNGSLRKPDMSQVVEYSRRDREVWKDRNDRMARDIRIFRQGEGGVPSLFDPEEDLQFLSAAMSNLVNRLSNMMSGIAIQVESPSHDEQSDADAQTVENWCHWDQEQIRLQYADDRSGVRQRDEFFYLLLHGVICARVLPDISDPDYQWTDDLMDPSTCYPVFGNGKQGLIRMTRVYTSSVGEILDTYSTVNRGLDQTILNHLGETTFSIAGVLHRKLELVEYWDRRWRAVCLNDGTPILPVVEHGYGRVPFVYVTAIGEPMSMQTPNGEYAIKDPVLGGLRVPVGDVFDMSQKGVSVIHYLVNTHRLREAIYTILYGQIEKAANPALIRYRAPQLMGKDAPTYDLRAGGNNYAVMGLEKIEAIPTSPAPTDVSPTIQALEQEQMAGGMNPASQGMEMGANASGYALDTLIAVAKEMILPYLQAFENYLMLKFRLKLELFRDVIGEFYSLRIPEKGLYGRPRAIRELTIEVVNRVGCHVKVKAKNTSDSAKMAQAQYATTMMSAGLMSQRAAMSEAGIDDPTAMLNEVLADNAMQHPQIMQLYGIPLALEARGATNLAQMWMEIVAKPVIQELMMQQAMMSNPMMAAQGGAGGGGSTPDTGGQSFGPTTQGQATGPAPGEGRGPAPQGV